MELFMIVSYVYYEKYLKTICPYSVIGQLH